MTPPAPPSDPPSHGHREHRPAVLAVDEVRRRAARIVAAGDSTPRVARDPVNQPMVNNWIEALDDRNPIYVDAGAARSAGHDDIVAPPAMLQVWTMLGLHQAHPPDDPIGLTFDLLDEAGCTAVVATDCEQTYLRYLRHGERVSMTSSLTDLVGPKQTSLGEGWFVTTRHTWHAAGEPVAEMRFRMFKYRAPAAGSGEGAGSAASTRRAVAPTPGAAADPLPSQIVQATPTFIIASALATRDFQDVHHDRDRAIGHGSQDIFVNILTDTGLVQRVVTDWTGPAARVHRIALRLLAPCYAYDTLQLDGWADPPTATGRRIHVVGRVPRAEHLVATVDILP